MNWIRILQVFYSALGDVRLGSGMSLIGVNEPGGLDSNVVSKASPATRPGRLLL